MFELLKQLIKTKLEMTSFYLYSHAAYFQRQYRTVGVVEVRHNIIAMYF